MIEPRTETQTASDGYSIHITVWNPPAAVRGRIVVLHGIQSHGGWYHRLGETLAQCGYAAYFPDRRGSGANRTDRGHAPSASRLLKDLAELLRSLRRQDAATPIAIAGISWGGKPAILLAGGYPALVDALVLICPGLHPRVQVSRREKLAIAWAWFTNRRKTFPIPLSDPALFTENPSGQEFIARDRLGLHAGTAGLLAASAFFDRAVRRVPDKVHQPALLMLAGQDRIVNNATTLGFFESLANDDRELIVYPEGHHTLEFEPDPARYAHDLVAWLDTRLRPNIAGAERVLS